MRPRVIRNFPGLRVVMLNSLKQIFYVPFSCREVDSSYGGCKNNGTAITGSEILEKLNVARTPGENIAILFLFVIMFRVVTYLSLRYVHKPR